MKKLTRRFAWMVGLTVAVPASAVETIDIGVIRDEDITVVQKLLYPKTDRTELGFHAGVMPFDAYVTTPNGQLSFARYFNERVALSVIAGGGYGLKTGVFKQLESPSFGVAPYAYRYLGSVLAGVEWAPVYAKMNINGARIVHFDVYGTGRAGLTVEQSVLPDSSLAFGPTVSLGIGGRLFTGQKSALHVAFRDDVLVERRKITQSTHIKQNANVTVGLTVFSGGG